MSNRKSCIGFGALAAITIGVSGHILSQIAEGFGPPHSNICSSNLRQLGLATLQYVQDNDERLPPRQTHNQEGKLVSWRALIYPYIKTKKFYRCPTNPAANLDDVEHDGFPRSYAVNSASDNWRRFGPFADKFSGGLRVSKIGRPESVVMVTETTAAFNDINPLLSEAFTQKFDAETKTGSLFMGHDGGAVVLFCDGHISLTRKTLTPIAGQPNPWTIDNAPFAPDDREKARRVMDFAQKQNR